MATSAATLNSRFSAGENLQAGDTGPRGGSRVDRGASQALPCPLRRIRRTHRQSETGGKRWTDKLAGDFLLILDHLREWDEGGVWALAYAR